MVCNLTNVITLPITSVIKMVIPISLFTLRFLPQHIIIRRILKEIHNRMVVLQILQPISDYKCVGVKFSFSQCISTAIIPDFRFESTI